MGEEQELTRKKVEKRSRESTRSQPDALTSLLHRQPESIPVLFSQK